MSLQGYNLGIGFSAPVGFPHLVITVFRLAWLFLCFRSRRDATTCGIGYNFLWPNLSFPAEEDTLQGGNPLALLPKE